MKKTLFLSIFIFTIFSISSSELCNPHDKKVLFQMKQQFGKNMFNSWTLDSDCCDWSEVRCDPTTNRVTTLYVLSGDISGPIPSVIGELPYLQVLYLHKLTNVTGNIPSSFTKLKYLRFLVLSWLNLTGEIPSFLGTLDKLTNLELSFNNFSGSIPSSLASLQNLEALQLDRNKLTGSIPESIGTLTKLTYLILSHNQLSGKIPSLLGNIDFNKVDLSRNKLEGDASFLFGANKTTQVVDLSRNILQFNFTNVVLPTSLIYLDINHNKIYGSIPERITEVDFLQAFNVSYNRLCGKIPVGGRLEGFDSTAYFHNKCLCGAPLQSCK